VKADYNNAYKTYKALGEDYRYLVNWTNSWKHYIDIVKGFFPADWEVGWVYKIVCHGERVGVAVYIDLKVELLSAVFNLRKALVKVGSLIQ